MTEKSVTNAMYELLWPAGLVERNGMYNIFKSNEREEYVSCKLDNNNSEISPLFNTIEQAREWLQP